MRLRSEYIVGKYLFLITFLLLTQVNSAQAYESFAPQLLFGRPRTEEDFKTVELIKLRTATTKVYDLGYGRKKYQIHLGNIHYQDNDGNWQNIDTTLKAGDSGLYADQAPHKIELPDTADGEFVYQNKDHSFNFKIVGLPKTKYELNNSTWGSLGKGIRYPNVFGDGIHFDVNNTNMGFEKLIVFDKPPADTSKDFIVRFEITSMPETVDVIDRDLSVIKTIDVTKSEDEATMITNSITQLTSNDASSYIWYPMTWDSSATDRKALPVTVYFYQEDGKQYLVKQIPKEIFENATYPIYADDTANYSPPAGDGYIENGYGVWDTIHDALAGNFTDYTFTGALDVGSYDNNGADKIFRAFLPINTAGITDTDTVTAATLYVYISAKNNGDNDGDDWIAVVGQTSQSSTTSLANADFDQCAAINNPTEGSERDDITSVSTSAYNNWVLNATAIGWINKTGVTMLGLREGHDVTDTPIYDQSGCCNGNRLSWYQSERTGTNQDPYLEVVTSSGTVTPARVMRLFEGFTIKFISGNIILRQE